MDWFLYDRDLRHERVNYIKLDTGDITFREICFAKALTKKEALSCCI